MDLVASGVSKDCKDEDLFQFLKDKGINPVSVVTLTRDEVLDQVRKKTFKVTVKAAQYEAALRPDIWPYRVAVRHFRAPRKQDETWNSQAGRSGGLIENANKNTRQQNGNSSLGLKNLPVGHPLQKTGQNQRMGNILPDPVQISNFFSILEKIGALENTSH